MSNLQRLAHQFLANAVALQKGEKLWLECAGIEAQPLAEACVAEAKKIGAAVHYLMRDSRFTNAMAVASDEELALLGQEDLAAMQTMDGYLRIGDVGDKGEVTVSLDDQARLNKVLYPALQHRVSNVRWLVVRAPTKDFAKACGMEYAAFQKFYDDACLLDYTRMYEPAATLGRILSDAKDVVIKGRETHLTFSIEGIGSKECIGKRNIPDGEVYTAPVKGSVEGTVLFGPSVYMGTRFSEIYLRYEAGRIVEARAGDGAQTAALNRILDMDEGARYPGEFALAFNPMIAEPVGDILFDEKVSGSWHFANGAAYKGQTDNGNESQIHWDKVQIQRSSHGGGEIWLDNRLIRKDGLFVVPELEGLNPARLCGPT